MLVKKWWLIGVVALKTCEGYATKDIFNCDETGLFYRTLPTRSLVVKGGKQAKDRITVLLCASVSGEKLQPLVIGKSRNPRSFKGYQRCRCRFSTSQIPRLG